MSKKELYLNIKGRLMDLSVPKIMGVINVTPDSFYSQSRTAIEEEIRESVARKIEEGADIIDVGGCSTRPGYQLPGTEVEWERVKTGCKAVREVSKEIPLSVDTFRAEIAKRAIREFEADIINDISGGEDPDMWPLTARERVAYILTHNRTDGNTSYEDVTANVVTELSMKLNELHRLGAIDVIIDPGFGFAKTLQQNFRLFDEIGEVARMGYPVLVGISRKSMIWKPLATHPEDALGGTIALNAIALEKGARILRVHDVKEAKETVALFNLLKQHA